MMTTEIPTTFFERPTVNSAIATFRKVIADDDWVSVLGMFPESNRVLWTFGPDGVKLHWRPAPAAPSPGGLAAR